MARAEKPNLRHGGGESEEKWLKYYSSRHQILLVGEGDFSFSLCLAQSFGSASNIVASSLDSYDNVRKYKGAKSNLDNLQKFGASVLHGVDAAKMKRHSDLKMRKFDRIIFNFPHAGFHGAEKTSDQIWRHRNLVLEFFRNARSMLRPNGEIHVNHKTTFPYSNWNIEQLGNQNDLGLIECVDFKKEDYPGYNNKRGHGRERDKSFHLGKCSTFKFSVLKKEKMKSDTINQRLSWFESINNVRNMNMIPSDLYSLSKTIVAKFWLLAIILLLLMFPRS